MEFHKGWIVDTVEDYEIKQHSLTAKYGINGRYSGRIIQGTTKPDVVLKSGKYFIPDKNGIDAIIRADIFMEDLS